jgi:cell division protein FtsB
LKQSGSRNRRSFYITLVSVFVIVIGILVFNRHGFIALAGLKGEVDFMSRRIDSLRIEIDSLEAEIERLRSDSLYLERMVREVLGWGRPGEIIIRFLLPDAGGMPF